MTEFSHKDLNIKFTCLAGCSNCCQLSGGFVFLTEQEAENIAAYLETDFAFFKEWFTRNVEGQLALVDGDEEHCVFLDEGACSVYPVRPQQCRTYPFWPENMKTQAHWNLTKKMCPGIGQGRKFSEKEVGDILKGKDLDSTR